MAEKIYDAYGQEIELTSEQEACLKYSGSRTLMVKGYAGAGKSIVLMAIAGKYLQALKGSGKNKVAILTFQNTLVSTMQETLLENDADDAIRVSTVNSLCKEIYEQMVYMGVAPSRKFPFGNTKMADANRVKNVEAALKAHKAKYGKHRFHDLDLKFWLEEFDWMKDMNVWTNDLDYYLTIPRTGRGGKVRMRTSERPVAYQIFEEYCRYLEKNGKGDWADQTLFIVRHRDMIPASMKYEHVLIDEAQDLSLAQMTAILGIYQKDMTVAMDMNQRIHSTHWTPKLLGIETTTKKLTTSMRTTKQIDNLAESIRRNNDAVLSEDDKSLRAIPEREGPIPKLVHLKDAAAEKKYVLELVKSYLKKNDKITIGIIGSKNPQLTLFSSWLTDAGIQHEIVTKNTSFSMKNPGVKVVTAYGAKGLEFNVVIIPNFAQGYFPYDYQPDTQEALDSYIVQMRNLVYVSMTRAKAQLVITYWGSKGSQFIAEMDPKCYQAEGEPIEGSYAKPIVPVKPEKIEFENGDGSAENSKKPVGQASAQNLSKYLAGLFKNKGIGSGSFAFSTSKSSISSAKTKNISTNAGTKKADRESLYDYLCGIKGITVNDKREKGGALWISGSKTVLDQAMKESKKSFGALWFYSEKRKEYFTKCTK